MSAVTAAPPSGGSGRIGQWKSLLDGGPSARPDVRVTYWIFVAFYMVMPLALVVFARAMPPPPPDVSDVQVADWFADHSTGIKIGFFLILITAGGAAISNGLIGYYMFRMSSGKTMAYAYIGAMGVGAVPGFVFLAVCWVAAVFRPDRPPEQMHLLYDLGMLSFNGSLGCFTAAYIALAIAILYDRNKIFPKWFAYVQLWQVVTEVLAAMMFVYRSGVYSWNGATTFWIAVIVFGAWIVCLFPILWKAGQDEPDDAPAIYSPEMAA